MSDLAHSWLPAFAFYLFGRIVSDAGKAEVGWCFWKGIICHNIMYYTRAPLQDQALVLPPQKLHHHEF